MKTNQLLAPLLAGAVALSTGEAFANQPDAANQCASPQPIFGKVVAVCGDQMITYVGDETAGILGNSTTTSRFELAYCSTGGGRKALSLETNSEGFTLVSSTYQNNEHYTVSNMWGSFGMSGIGVSGEKIEVGCVLFEDKRTNIEYSPGR